MFKIKFGDTYMHEKKIAYGMICAQVTELSPVTDFFDNARKYGHKIDHLIICYKDYYDDSVIEKFKQFCKVTLIQRGHAPFIENNLKDIGMNNDDVDSIIGTPYLEKYNKVSYGTSRNYVILTAIFLKIDYLFFFDSDIFPIVLKDYKNGKSEFREVDFVGSHLKYLKQEDVVVTTSDYTGYYIIPKMNFPYLMELLQGVQKEDRFYYITSVDTPVTRDKWQENIFNTNKVLGGNLAIDLKHLSLLPPFFSTMLILGNECFMGRGEDTLFGPIIYSFGGRCVDIDLLVFHNCFGDFPNKPAITIQKNVDRFFYACMGWIIRNPFFNWLRNEFNSETEEINTERRYHALQKGSTSAAEYFGDKRFLNLPQAFEMSYKKLPEDIDHFYNLTDSWKKMKKLLNK